MHFKKLNLTISYNFLSFKEFLRDLKDTTVFDIRRRSQIKESSKLFLEKLKNPKSYDIGKLFKSFFEISNLKDATKLLRRRNYK